VGTGTDHGLEAVIRGDPKASRFPGTAQSRGKPTGNVKAPIQRKNTSRVIRKPAQPIPILHGKYPPPVGMKKHIRIKGDFAREGNHGVSAVGPFIGGRND
jgi:hypothetical protein